MKEEIAPHVKDITRALGSKVSEEEIEKELDNYLNVYKVSLETAKRSIVKKHGGNPYALSVGVQKNLAELASNETNVNLLCRVLSVNPREIEVEGGTKKILYGILGDESGTAPFTAWRTEGLEIQRGDTIRVQNAYTREFRGKVQVNFGNRTLVTKEEGEALPSLQALAKPSQLKVIDLRDGASNLSLVARIVSLEKREVEINGEKRVVFSGLLGDETSRTQFTSWKDFNLKEGEAVRIDGGYVRSWRGIPQLTFDARSQVTKLEESQLPPLEEISKSPRVWIEELAERGGAVDVTVRGILIEVKNGSGLIHRCPDCRRVLRKGTCRIHGEVDGIPDLRIKAILDDGSGAITAIFGKELTEELLNKRVEECIEEAREAMNQEIIRDELADILIAQPMEARGNVTSDDYGLMMIVDSAKILRVDVQEEAKAMLEELEG